MNENTPMTPAQQLFAEEHHNLVYAFLNEKKLPEDEYYDVVVFGYLQAVMDYTTQGESSRFSFATIAWRKMESRLADHFRHQASTKRAAPTVSLNAVMDDAGLSLSDMLSAADESFLEMEIGLLFHDLGRHMPRRDMNVLRLKADGYGTREIAQRENTTVHMVQSIRQHKCMHRMIKHLLDLVDAIPRFHMEYLCYQILQQMPHLLGYPVALRVVKWHDLQLVIVEIPCRSKR